MFVGLRKNPWDFLFNRHPPLGSAWKKSTRALHPPRFNVEAENDAFQVWFISVFHGADVQKEGYTFGFALHIISMIGSEIEHCLFSLKS